jgi:hypothetical protein
MVFQTSLSGFIYLFYFGGGGEGGFFQPFASFHTKNLG